MRTLKLTLAYDGGAYAGWQLQLGQPTIQSVLEAALERVTRETIRVSGSGRTDAGVHALGQVASCCTGSALSTDVLLRALNAELPDDVAVLDLCDVPAEFHARRSAERKRYRYLLRDAPVRDVFRQRHHWHVLWPLDDAAMHRAAQSWLGTHDFTSFESQGSPRESSVRTVFLAQVERQLIEGGTQVAFEVEANGFLYNMVRAMTGTLVEIGRGRRSEAWGAEALAARDRAAAGPTAPPQGLYLVSVSYPAEAERLPGQSELTAIDARQGG